MILVNAIYFKGYWTYAFNKSLTTKGKFYLTENDTVTVNYMKMSDVKLPYTYLINLDAHAFEMPYRDCNISMMIIKPNSKSLDNVETRLRNKAINLLKLSKLMDMQGVDIEVPKFKITHAFKLSDEFKKVNYFKVN